MSEDTAASALLAPFYCLFSSIYCLPMIFGVIMMIVSLLGMVLWIFMLIDVAKRDDKDFPQKGENQKIMWILIVALTSYIGAGIYYFLVYKKMGAAK
jgi:prolipoprotein diacylglyceryltransferase